MDDVSKRICCSANNGEIGIMSDMGRKRKESWMGGAEFAEIRESLGYTQTEFAKLLDVTSTAISHYEIERTPIPKVLMLLVKAMKSGKITTK